MYTTSYPIRVPFTSATKSNEYVNYEISLGYWDGTALSYDLLYNGKTFFDGNGNSSIEFARLLRNYQTDFAPVWDDERQKFMPKDYYTFSISTSTMYPIEQAGSMKFANGVFKIEPEDETAKYIYACQMANQFYTDSVHLPNTVFDVNNQNVLLINYNRLYHCVNHIPFNKSENSMFGWFFGRNKYMMDAQAGAKTMLRAKNHHTAIELNVTSFGDYYGTCKCSELMTGLSIYYEDDLYLTTPYNVNTQYDEKYHVAHIDFCPRDFYVNWWDSCGWHCLGFDGNVEIGNTSDNKSITTTLGIEAVYATQGKCTFNLNSGYVEPEVVATIMTLKNAKAIFVNDIRNDKGQWCTLKGISNDGLTTNNAAKPQNVQVKLEEAIMFKS